MAYVLLLGISLIKLFYISSSASHPILIEKTVNIFRRKYNSNSNFGHFDSCSFYVLKHKYYLSLQELLFRTESSNICNNLPHFCKETYNERIFHQLLGFFLKYCLTHNVLCWPTFFSYDFFPNKDQQRGEKDFLESQGSINLTATRLEEGKICISKS